MDILSARLRYPRRQARNIGSVKVRVGHWFSNIWEDMRRKSPVAVQHWVDSLPPPATHQSSADVISETITENHNSEVINLDVNTTNNSEKNLIECKDFARCTEAANKKIDDSLTQSKSDDEKASHTVPVRIPRRGTIVREASLPSDSPHRRRLLLRDSSFQSDDAISHCSSVDSLLESRRADPEAVLLGLGFGPSQSQTDLSRIPQRFLGPSKVRGVDTDQFLKQQQLERELHDSGVWGYRGLTGDPHSPPSVIVAKIMERIHARDQQSQYLETCSRDSDS